MPSLRHNPIARPALLGLGLLLVLIFAFELIAMHWEADRQRRRADYVALGSSFAAGPGIGTRAPDSYYPCMRSDENYAHLLAKEAQLNLRDVTCAGATTEDVLHGGQFFQPPQVEAVTGDTKLVTITVGGNDVSYLSSLGAWACANAPSVVPDSARWLGLCRKSKESMIDKAFTTLPAQMTSIAREVRRRAPAARIIFVDLRLCSRIRGLVMRCIYPRLRLRRGDN